MKYLMKNLIVTIFVSMIIYNLVISIPINQKETPFLDFELRTPATKCFQILLVFSDGWLDNMLKIKDSLEIICPNMIDVRIEYEGIIQDYTMEEFLERLGFKDE